MTSVQIRTPTFLTLHGHRTLCQPRQIVHIADEIADRLILDGRAIPVEVPETPGEEAVPAFDDLTVEKLQALADERGLTVEGTGQGGKVIKADLVNALTETVE